MKRGRQQDYLGQLVLGAQIAIQLQPTISLQASRIDAAVISHRSL